MKELIKLNYLGKNSCEGKIAAICNLVDDISFRGSHIRNTIIKQYMDYMINYLHYDKVYILGPTIEPKKVTNILSIYEDNIVWGNENEHWFESLNIDDIFLTQMTCTFFGGVIKDAYFRQAINIVNWYNENKKIFIIQDDPVFYINNPTSYIDERLFINKNLKIYHNYYDKFDKYHEISNELSNILDNCIVAYCGSDYQTYYNNIMSQKRHYLGLPSTASKWDNFECYYYQGMNDNLINKFIDFPFENKKYDCEYHGYVKNSKRIKLTESYYKELKNKFMCISQKDKFFNNIDNYDFVSSMGYYELIQYIATNSKTSLILADEITFNTFVSPRWFDCMLSDIVAFVYTPYDKNKTLVDDEFLKEFMYVDSPEDFAKKVELISSDKKLYEKVKYLQRLTTYKIFGKYCLDSNKKIFEDKLNLGK